MGLAVGEEELVAAAADPLDVADASGSASSMGWLRILAKVMRKSASFQVRPTVYWAMPRR